MEPWPKRLPRKRCQSQGSSTTRVAAIALPGQFARRMERKRTRDSTRSAGDDTQPLLVGIKQRPSHGGTQLRRNRGIASSAAVRPPTASVSSPSEYSDDDDSKPILRARNIPSVAPAGSSTLLDCAGAGGGDENEPLLGARVHNIAVGAQAGLPACVSAAAPCEEVEPVRDVRESISAQQCGQLAISAMAARLRRGRTPAIFAALRDTRLMHVDDVDSPLTLTGDGPRRGAQAQHDGREVLIVDTYTSHGVAKSDVVDIVQKPKKRNADETFELGEFRTADAQDLHDIGYRYNMEVKRARLLLRRRYASENDSPDDAVRHISDLHTALQQCQVFEKTVPAGAWRSSVADAEGVRAVVPGAALAHVAERAALGERHHTLPESGRHTGPHFVLSLPQPIEIDLRPHRCRQCRGTSDSCYYTVQDDDIRREFPGVLIHKTPKQAPIYMTAAFLFELCHQFYCELNARQVKRQVASLYSANALAAAISMEKRGAAPYSLAWQLQAVPKCKVLRSVVVRAFRAFVSQRVAVMRKRQILYNAQGLRHDGNYKLAKRIYIRGERPFSVVIAICGVDGSLIDVIRPRATEAWPDIKAVLEPLLMEIKEVRLAHGCSLSESVPVFHSTDVHRQHRRLIRKLYRKVWPELRLQAIAPAPKAAARRARLRRRSQISRLLSVTGDPLHDRLALRRVLPVTGNDTVDIGFDHDDIMARLSKRDRPDGEAHMQFSDATAVPLSQRGRTLLRIGVQRTASAFKSVLRRGEAATDDLRAFLRQPGVQQSPVWQEMFGAEPPRGTVARLARRAAVSLHLSMHAHGWGTIQEFSAALRRMKAWYEPGRKLQRRRRRGIKRRLNEPDHMQGRPSAWNDKVDAHYKRLLKPLRRKGLWKWRACAQALHRAGIAVHTGTVPVERMWSFLLDVFPKAARTMSPGWFELLADLPYMRVNYRHFNYASLPGWTEGDSLLAERIDMMVSLTRALHAEDSASCPTLEAVTRAFAPAEV